jgi:hypothetical protein
MVHCPFLRPTFSYNSLDLEGSGGAAACEVVVHGEGVWLHVRRPSTVRECDAASSSGELQRVIDSTSPEMAHMSR